MAAEYLAIFKKIKDVLQPILVISKPFVEKIIDEKIIPAAKTWIYTSLQKKKDKAINKLAILLAKYKTETDETKKKAHKVGLTLGADSLEAIGQSMIEAAQEIKSKI